MTKKAKKIVVFSILGGGLAAALVRPAKVVVTKMTKIKELKAWAKKWDTYLRGKYPIPADPLGRGTSVIKKIGLDEWNRRKLESLVPEYRPIVQDILNEGKKLGFDKMFLWETNRSLDRQVDIYGKGRWDFGKRVTQVFMSKKAGHTWGRAVDILWYGSPLGGWWKLPKGMYEFLREMSAKYNLEGPWSWDRVHLQLKTGVSSEMLADIDKINSEFHAKLKGYNLA